MPNVTDIETLAPPVLLVLFCNFIGWIAGTIPSFNNKYIPVLMFVVGATVYPFIGTVDAVTIRHSNVKMIVIGACIGGAAVGTNQIFRQFMSKYEKSDS